MEKKMNEFTRERLTVEKSGGVVKLLSLLEGKSTTRLIDKITGQLNLQYL